MMEVLSEQLNFLKANPALTIGTLAAIVVAVALLLGLGWHQTTRKPPLRQRWVMVILALAFGLLLLNYFFPGDFVRGDGPSHITRGWLMLDILENQELPIWSNRWYFGFPQEMFYGPLTYLLIGGTAKLLNGDVFTSTKLILWLLHVASGVLMYAYARRRFLNDALSFLAATAYVLSWQHFGVVRRFGVLPLALIYALLPLFFLLLETYLKKESRLLFAVVAGGILCTLAVLTHLQYGVYLSATYFAVILWMMLVYGLYRDWPNVRQTLLLFVGTGVAAALLGGWFVVPSALERVYLPSIPAIVDTLSLAGMKEAVLNIALVSRLFDSWGQGYVGLTILIPALIGIFIAVKRLAGHQNRSAVLIQGYPFVIAIVGFILLDPIKRYTGIWFFFVCVVAAYGIRWLAQNWTAPRKLLTVQVATALIVLEMGASLLLVGDFLKVDQYHDDVARLQQQIEPGGVPSRIMVFKPDRSVFWRSQDVIETGASVAFGGLIESATNTFNFMAAISTRLAKEVYDSQQTPSATTLELLRLVNIRYVLLDDETVIEVPYASPVIFAPDVRQVTAQDSNGVMGMSVRTRYEDRTISTEYVDAAVSQMNLKREQPEANAILVNDVFDTTETTSAGCLAQQPFAFQSAREQHTSFAFEYTACGSGYIRLAYAYYPLLRLEIDGVETPFYRDAIGMIVFRAPEGNHRVTLTAVVSPLRAALFVVALVTAGVLVVSAIIRLIVSLWGKSHPDVEPKVKRGYL